MSPAPVREGQEPAQTGPADWTSKDAMDLLYFKTVMRCPLTLYLWPDRMPAASVHEVLILMKGHMSSLILVH